MVEPYETESVANAGDPFGFVPAGSNTSVVTDAGGDPEIQSGPNQAAQQPYDEVGRVVIHGSIAADTTTLTVPGQLSAWDGGSAVPPTGTNQVSVDASALAGSLNVTVVQQNATFSSLWYFTNTYLTVSAVDPLGNVTFNGLDHNDLPYPYEIDVANSGQGFVTVGNGSLSAIQGNVTINNAELTVDNSESTSSDILTMTGTALRRLVGAGRRGTTDAVVESDPVQHPARPGRGKREYRRRGNAHDRCVDRSRFGIPDIRWQRLRHIPEWRDASARPTRSTSWPPIQPISSQSTAITRSMLDVG